MLVTVFTPTYNRAHLIGTLYESLCRQSFRDFEWLVVDDGSTDHTEAVISQFKAEERIFIRYIWQENGGKHRENHPLWVVFAGNRRRRCDVILRAGT